MENSIQSKEDKKIEISLQKKKDSEIREQQAKEWLKTNKSITVE